MLIPSPKHTEADLELWRELEEADRVHAQAIGRRVGESIAAIREFVSRGPCYAGVSWGKDSVVVADLIQRVTPHVPLCWVRVEPIKNPDCEAVRDAFLSRYPAATYHEVEAWCTRDASGWHARGTLESGTEQLERLFGQRHILGIRGDESTVRGMRVGRWGLNAINASAPLGHWSAADVMAYLAAHNLPVHPAYAMMGGGRWPRQHLRVASLGGKRGEGHGRAEWEREYYGEALRRIEALKQPGELSD